MYGIHYLTFITTNHFQSKVEGLGLWCAAYGSSKDIYVYKELGLTQSQIFIVGKASKKDGTKAQVRKNYHNIFVLFDVV
jgi:hypothetical protein